MDEHKRATLGEKSGVAPACRVKPAACLPWQCSSLRTASRNSACTSKPHSRSAYRATKFRKFFCKLPFTVACQPPTLLSTPRKKSSTISIRRIPSSISQLAVDSNCRGAGMLHPACPGIRTSCFLFARFLRIFHGPANILVILTNSPCEISPKQR